MLFVGYSHSNGRSTMCIDWISSTKLLPEFIENRLKDIREHLHAKFHSVNTKDNPAEITARGVSMLHLCDENLH